MKYLKRNLSEIPREEAHGGSGARQMLLHPDYLTSSHWEAVTKGYLNNGRMFDWHNHIDVDEIFIVTKGRGTFFFREGNEEIALSYKADDVVIVPSNIFHKIVAEGEETTEGFFCRIKAAPNTVHSHKVVLLHISDISLEEVHKVPESRQTLVTSDVIATDYLEAITKGILRAGHEWDYHQHENTDELCIILHGEGTYFVGEEHFTWQKDDVVIVPANTLHKLQATANSEMYFIRVKQ